jgi:hypothetical protein
MTDPGKVDRISNAIDRTVDLTTDLVDALENLNAEFETYERNDQSISLALGNAVISAILKFSDWVEENHEDPNQCRDKRNELIIEAIEPIIKNRLKCLGELRRSFKSK